jgi:hypothetical protein
MKSERQQLDEALATIEAMKDSMRSVFIYGDIDPIFDWVRCEHNEVDTECEYCNPEAENEDEN